MGNVITPKWVKNHNHIYQNMDEVPESIFNEVREKMSSFSPEKPEVSIVIIAHNEEQNILKALSSLADTVSALPTEILVINNNSSDNTQEILDKCGVLSVNENRLGIGWARQKGLESAKGKIMLNADADSIYPPTWSASMAQGLTNPAISTVYSRYSFVASKKRHRPFLFIHEFFARMLFSIRRKHAHPINVMGFSFGFRRKDALEVGGFEVNANYRWEDGLMVLALTKLGDIFLVKNEGARVWTSDRRLIIDGGYLRAFFQRTRKHLGYLPDYLNLKNIFSREP